LDSQEVAYDLEQIFDNIAQARMKGNSLSTKASPELTVRVLRWCLLLCGHKLFNKSCFVSV